MYKHKKNAPWIFIDKIILALQQTLPIIEIENLTNEDNALSLLQAMKFTCLDDSRM